MGRQWIELCRQPLPEKAPVRLGDRPAIDNCHVIEDLLTQEGLGGFLARPHRQRGPDMEEIIVWTVEVDSSEEYKIERFLALEDSRQDRIRAEISANVQRIQQAGIPGGADAPTKELDRRLLAFPDESFIYVVNGKPVITGWGFSDEPEGDDEPPPPPPSPPPPPPNGVLKVVGAAAAAVAFLGLIGFAAVQRTALAHARSDLQERDKEVARLKEEIREKDKKSNRTDAVTAIEAESPVDLRITEASLLLTWHGRSSEVKWSIEILSDAPEYVKKHPRDFISFLHQPDHAGSKADGSVVFLRVKPEETGPGFKAKIVGSDRTGEQGVATLQVGGSLTCSR